METNVNLKNIKISAFKYIFTNIGGGWGTIHNFYGITPNGDVYTTKEFDEDALNINTEICCEYIGHLDQVILGLRRKTIGGVMDASYLVVCEVGDELKVVYEGSEVEGNNPYLFDEIQKLAIYSHYRKALDELEKKEDKSTGFFVGEIAGEDVANKIRYITSGIPVRTTFHANDNQEVVRKIQREMFSGKENNNEPTLEELANYLLDK